MDSSEEQVRTVVSLLQAALQADPLVRQAAEQQLVQLKTADGFGATVAKVSKIEPLTQGPLGCDAARGYSRIYMSSPSLSGRPDAVMLSAAKCG